MSIASMMTRGCIPLTARLCTHTSLVFLSSHLSLKKRHTLNGFHFSVRSGGNDGSCPFSSHAVASISRLLEHGCDFVDGAALCLRNLLPREQDEQGEKDDEDQEHVGADNLERKRKRKNGALNSVNILTCLSVNSVLGIKSLLLLWGNELLYIFFSLKTRK